jgi:hypothetical protein
MQMGQVPTMFVPEAPIFDVQSNTMPTDVEMATMLPEGQILAEPLTILQDTRAWLFIGAALVVWWAMRKPRR